MLALMPAPATVAAKTTLPASSCKGMLSMLENVRLTPGAGIDPGHRHAVEDLALPSRVAGAAEPNPVTKVNVAPLPMNSPLPPCA